MPIPEDIGRGAPQADSRVIAYIERRREEEARDRRQRLQLGTIACLGGIVLILTVSNAVLLSRLLARPPAPPAVAPAPMSAPAAPSVSTASPAAPLGNSPVAPPAAEMASPTAQREEPLVPSEPRTPRAARVARSPVAARPLATALRSSSPSFPGDPAALPGETDSAQRTARWLVETYGPLEAEGRALAAADFYTGADREFWRRVARHVHAHAGRGHRHLVP
jgi:hypothetical protein